MKTTLTTIGRRARANPLTRHALLWLTALAVVMVLQACGGGETNLTNNTNTTPTTQMAKGMVTGFGSVVVDGVEIDDHKAKVSKDQADGSSQNSALELGQQVRVVRGSDGAATQITIDAAISGRVSSIDFGNNRLTIAAQVVRINTTDKALPITYFGGAYSGITDIDAKHFVEVHGTPIFDTTTSKYQIQATRIQPINELVGYRVMGTVTGLNTTAKTFTLNGLTVQYSDERLYPSTATLADGLTVVAFAKSDGALKETTLTASSLRIYPKSDTTPVARSTAQLSGIVSDYNKSTGLFTMQGLTIRVGTVAPTPSGAVIQNGSYVLVTGTVNATSGIIDVTTIKVRQANVDSDLAKIKLIGPISSFDANSKTMVVRNVPVDFDSATITCTQTLADDLVVSVLAEQQTGTDVVLAKTIGCSLPAGTVIQSYLGLPSAVNTTTNTFTLTVTSSAGATSTKSVQWNDNTVFKDVTKDTLAGLATTKVLVEGYVSNGVLVARSIRVLSNDGGDRFRGEDKEKARDDYRGKKPKK